MEELLKILKRATNVLESRDIDYIVFGGIAVWAYGRRRKTHDIDLLIKEGDAKETLRALSEVGFMTEETDHTWLYKATLDQSDIDLIFKAKGGIKLTPEILQRQRQLEIGGYNFRVIDPENLVILKILATKEVRPADWYDALSILERTRNFDWNYLISKSQNDILRFLSFVFFAQAMSIEKTGRAVVPPQVIDELYDDYHRGQGISKIA